MYYLKPCFYFDGVVVHVKYIEIIIDVVIVGVGGGRRGAHAVRVGPARAGRARLRVAPAQEMYKLALSVSMCN